MNQESTLTKIVKDSDLTAGSSIIGSKVYTIDKSLDDRNHVFRGHDEDGKAIVVKSYSGGIASCVQKEKFARETNVQEILAQHEQHDNLLISLDIIDDQQGQFVIYPFLEGDTMDNLFDRLGKLMPGDVLPLLRGVCHGLDRLHIDKIIHRDVKPQNIIVSYSGDCDHPDREALREEGDSISTTLFDFDISLHPHTRHLDMEGSFLGTLKFIAPELWYGEEATRASDIYALGIILYRAFTRRYPFSSPGKLELSRQHNYLPMPNPRDYNKKLPLDAVLVLEKALAKIPADRYIYAYELLRDFEAIQ